MSYFAKFSIFAGNGDVSYPVLLDHIHDSVDKIAIDFMTNRLPLIEQKEEAMKDDKGEIKMIG